MQIIIFNIIIIIISSLNYIFQLLKSLNIADKYSISSKTENVLHLLFFFSTVCQVIPQQLSTTGYALPGT